MSPRLKESSRRMIQIIVGIHITVKQEIIQESSCGDARRDATKETRLTQLRVTFFFRLPTVGIYMLREIGTVLQFITILGTDGRHNNGISAIPLDHRTQ